MYCTIRGGNACHPFTHTDVCKSSVRDSPRRRDSEHTSGTPRDTARSLKAFDVRVANRTVDAVCQRTVLPRRCIIVRRHCRSDTFVRHLVAGRSDRCGRLVRVGLEKTPPSLQRGESAFDGVVSTLRCFSCPKNTTQTTLQEKTTNVETRWRRRPPRGDTMVVSMSHTTSGGRHRRGSRSRRMVNYIDLQSGERLTYRTCNGMRVVSSDFVKLIRRITNYSQLWSLYLTEGLDATLHARRQMCICVYTTIDTSTLS